MTRRNVREQLVEAGLKTLLEKGFNGCGVQEITEGIALSAQVTGPSKKSQIEDKIARELLAALQGTETLQESE